MSISRGFGIHRAEKGPEINSPLTKRKGITDNPSLQGGLTLRKDGIDLSIEPNPDDPYEQKINKERLVWTVRTYQCVTEM